MGAERRAWFAGPPRPSFLRACHPICSSYSCAVQCTRFLEPQIECGPCRQKFDPASNRFHLRQPAVRFESRFDLGM